MKFASTLSGLLQRNGSGAPDPARTAAARLVRHGAPARELDLLLIWSVVGLLLLGLVMVYSASIAIAEGSRFTGYQPYYFVMRQKKPQIELYFDDGSMLAFPGSLRTWSRNSLRVLAGLDGGTSSRSAE